MDSGGKCTLCWLITILVIYGSQLFSQSNAACTWPSAFTNSTWYDSARGPITFNTSTMHGWTFSSSAVVTVSDWDCVVVNTFNVDGRMILISKSFMIYSSTFYAYLCITLTKVTDSSYRYYINRPINIDLKNERLFVYSVNTVTDPGYICSDSDGASGGEYQMLIKLGNEVAAKVRCPWFFLGRYGYVHKSSNGTSTCDSYTSEMTMCSDSQSMSFNYTKCSTKVAYSVSNTVWCVDNVVVGNTNYAMVYNGIDAESAIDNQFVYRFSCIAISENRSSASISPQFCQTNQSPYLVPVTATNSSRGAVVSLSSPRELCPTCSVLPKIDNGSFTITTTGAVTSANYTCNTSYTLWGISIRTCAVNNSWTDSEPTCSCASPLTPTNGTVNVNFNGSMATYTCLEGYTINGLHSRVCQSATATWKDSDPTCVKCDNLTTKPGQTYTLSTNNTVTSATVVCKSGYTLSGTSPITCTSNGTWYPTQPDCAACDALSNPPSGTVNVSTNGVVATATYKCASGYSLQGDSKRTCGPNGTWDNTEPVCTCNTPSSPNNGTVVANGSLAIYTCSVGFAISGSSIRACQSDSSGWNGTIPSCVACSTLSSVTGGSYVLTTTGAVSSAKYTCTLGFTISGLSTITCGADGLWNAPEPSCVKCQSLANLSSGTVTLSTTGTTTSATYACATGYNLIGSTIRLCNSDGTWTFLPPICSCQAPSSPQNGNVTVSGATASYTCQVGYNLAGDSSLTCSTNGSGWNATSPTCVACPHLTSSSGSAFVQSTDGLITTATFTCDVGYSLNGHTPLICRDNGSWDNTQPSCDTCATVFAPNSGNISINTNGLQTTATFSCHSGYYISGAYMITCGAGGVWNNVEPKCECSFPPMPSNGNVAVLERSVGMVATYTCNTGYSLMGLNTRACKSDGSGWEGTAPNCTMCQSVLIPASATFALGTNGTHTYVQYTCNGGSTINGERLLTCQSNGAWSSSAPLCVTCPTLTNITNGHVTLSTDGAVTIATLSCDSGYKLNTTNTITCTTAGTWSEFVPYCVVEENSSSSSSSSSINLLPAVIVLTVLLTTAIGVLLWYRRKFKTQYSNLCQRAITKPKEVSENGFEEATSHSFKNAKPPVDHQQHLMQVRNSQTHSAAPASHYPTPSECITSTSSLKTMTPIMSRIHKEANVIKSINEDVLEFSPFQPAPWHVRRNDKKEPTNHAVTKNQSQGLPSLPKLLNLITVNKLPREKTKRAHHAKHGSISKKKNSVGHQQVNTGTSIQGLDDPKLNLISSFERAGTQLSLMEINEPITNIKTSMPDLETVQKNAEM